MEAPFLVIIGIILLALVDFFNKLAASTGISPLIGSLMFGIAAIFPPAIWMAVYKIKNVSMMAPSKGIMLAILAGLFIGIMDIVWYRIFQIQSVSLSVSVMRTGGIALVFILGVLLLKEKMDLQGVFGFLLALTGVFLLMNR